VLQNAIVNKTHVKSDQMPISSIHI